MVWIKAKKHLASWRIVVNRYCIKTLLLGVKKKILANYCLNNNLLLQILWRTHRHTVITTLGQSHLLRSGQHPWASHRWVVMALKFKLHLFLGVALFYSCRWLVKMKGKAFCLFVLLILHFFSSFSKDFYSGIPPHLEEPSTKLFGTAGLSQWPPGAESAVLQSVWCARHPCASQLLPPALAPGQSWATPCLCKCCHPFSEDRPRMVHLEGSPTCLHCCYPPPSRGATQSSVAGLKGGKSSLSPAVCISGGGSERGRSLFWLLLRGRGLQLQLPSLTLCSCWHLHNSSEVMFSISHRGISKEKYFEIVLWFDEILRPLKPCTGAGYQLPQAAWGGPQALWGLRWRRSNSWHPWGTLWWAGAFRFLREDL